MENCSRSLEANSSNERLFPQIYISMATVDNKYGFCHSRLWIPSLHSIKVIQYCYKLCSGGSWCKSCLQLFSSLKFLPTLSWGLNLFFKQIYTMKFLCIPNSSSDQCVMIILFEIQIRFGIFFWRLRNYDRYWNRIILSLLPGQAPYSLDVSTVT